MNDWTGRTWGDVAVPLTQDEREIVGNWIRGIESMKWNPTQATKMHLARILRDYLELRAFADLPEPYPSFPCSIDLIECEPDAEQRNRDALVAMATRYGWKLVADEGRRSQAIHHIVADQILEVIRAAESVPSPPPADEGAER